MRHLGGPASALRGPSAATPTRGDAGDGRGERPRRPPGADLAGAPHSSRRRPPGGHLASCRSGALPSPRGGAGTSRGIGGARPPPPPHEAARRARPKPMSGPANGTPRHRSAPPRPPSRSRRPRPDKGAAVRVAAGKTRRGHGAGAAPARPRLGARTAGREGSGAASARAAARRVRRGHGPRAARARGRPWGRGGEGEPMPRRWGALTASTQKGSARSCSSGAPRPGQHGPLPSVGFKRNLTSAPRSFPQTAQPRQRAAAGLSIKSAFPIQNRRAAAGKLPASPNCSTLLKYAWALGGTLKLRRKQAVSLFCISPFLRLLPLYEMSQGTGVRPGPMEPPGAIAVTHVQTNSPQERLAVGQGSRPGAAPKCRHLSNAGPC